MAEKHEFVAKDGTVYEFDTHDDMVRFGTEYAIGNLVADGYGEIITDENGEQAFKINEKGLQHFKEMTEASVN